MGFKVTSTSSPATRTHHLGDLTHGQIVVADSTRQHWMCIGEGVEKKFICIESGYLSVNYSRKNEFVSGILLPPGSEVTITTA